MGAQWKHAGRQANSAKKGAIIGKLVKEIIVSAKIGDPSPDNNSRLRVAIEAAKKQSVPRDTIERAIKKATGQLGEVNYETILYEGFAPHRVPVIVECLTDNKNRTASDVRVLFRKGQLGNMGSVSFLFDRLGVIEATRVGTYDVEEAAIEAGAQNVEKMTAEADEVPAGSTGGRFFCEPTDLDAASKSLSAQGWTVTQAELSYIAKTPVNVESEADKKEVIDFLEALDDNDDVHRLYTAFNN
jgi:YebC/PmpR family DNA-binding regulatory protein